MLKEVAVWQGKKNSFLRNDPTGLMQRTFLIVLVPDQDRTCSPSTEDVLLLLLKHLYVTVSLQRKGRLGNLAEVDLIYESERAEKKVICSKGFSESI